VKGRFAVAAVAPARLAFGRDQAKLLIVTQRRCRHGAALGHLADVDQLIGYHQMGVAVHDIPTAPFHKVLFREAAGFWSVW
jgi:hypothetical protein